MKLASVISVWADCVELLPFCIKNHLEFCDGVIVVWSQRSNHGEVSDSVLEWILSFGYSSRVDFVQVEPIKTMKPALNETRKRNQGIDVAKAKGFTHVLVSDADEFYNPLWMNGERRTFEMDEKLSGMVHATHVFVKLPTLWCNDHTRVPGIQKLTKKFYVGNFIHYPWCYDVRGAHIDPTRRPNTTANVEFVNSPMYHMSYVRKNIDLKINNSSANLKRSREVIYEELRDAKPGYVSKLYHQELKECENFFNIVI